MLGLKTIDGYIIRKFLGTFLYAIAIIICIVIIFDISEKLDDFLRTKASLHSIIFDYYINFIPFFINLFSPLFTFISVIFFTSKMASNTEIVAILSSGVSFRRFLLPYMMAAAVLATLSFILINFVIPKANKKRLEFEESFIRNRYMFNDMNVHRQIEPGTYIYMESYNNIDNIGFKFALEKIVDGKLKSKLIADNIVWDTIKHEWQINNYYSRKIYDFKESIKVGATMDTILNMHPKDFGTRLNNVETMNYFELNKFIEKETMKGSDEVPFFMIEKYQRMSMPFSTFILTLIGVALASRKVRGGIGLHIGLGILLSFSYILFMQVANTFATYGGLHPLIAVWIPNVIFLFIAILLLRTAPK
jgi:lipopolysaccharide export system permease protein